MIEERHPPSSLRGRYEDHLVCQDLIVGHRQALQVALTQLLADEQLLAQRLLGVLGTEAILFVVHQIRHILVQAEQPERRASWQKHFFGRR